MTIKINTKKRDDVKALLSDHQAVTDALVNLSKSGFVTQITVSKDDDSDFTSVDLTHFIAKRALTEQKNWIEAELKKLGIELT
jgi:hypothetical protein